MYPSLPHPSCWSMGQWQSGSGWPVCGGEGAHAKQHSIEAPTSGDGLKLKIKGPLSWVFTSLTFLPFLQLTNKQETWSQVIIHIAQRHRGRGWQACDRLFQQQAVASSPSLGGRSLPHYWPRLLFWGVTTRSQLVLYRQASKGTLPLKILQR